VRQAYADGLVDSTVAGLEEIERDLAAPKPWRHERLCLITDAINEMEWWAGFHREDSQPEKLPKLQAPLPPPPAPAPASYTAPQPFVRQPKIGRNDPCPCGSGKKYKKCCGKG
jgi:preprotein translocase subunit SecA